MNLPNRLTVMRVVLIPFFLLALLLPVGAAYVRYALALVIFSVAAITDFFDGKIARERNLITSFGKLMDPLADKLLVISAFLAFMQLNKITAVPVIIIIAREFLVTSVRMIALENSTVIAANNWGKAKTVVQITSCIVIMLILIIEAVLYELFPSLISFSEHGVITILTNIIPHVLIWISAAITFASGMTYVLENKEMFKDM